MEDVLEAVVRMTSSETTVWIVLFVVFCVVFVLPFYMALLANRKAVKEMYTQREQHLIQVISDNSQAMARNTQIIADFRDTLKSSEERASTSMKRIHERIDDLVQLTIKVAARADAAKGVNNDAKQFS